MDPGTVFAERFVVERLAGTGGMGSVYRARDLRTGEIVALKVMRSHSAMDEERFAREAEILAELRHPGIVRYVGHGVTAGELGERWLAMEWLEGHDLGVRLEDAPLPVGESLILARLCAEALGAAHRAGIVHRDIKPENIYLAGGDYRALKLLDFGIARAGAAQARGVTRTGTTIGTPAYMAPEQARGARSVTPRADVFALGCVLFECLTGRAPFVGDNVMAVLAKLLLEDPPRLADVRPDVAPELDALLGRLLAKDPEGRPADGAEAAKEIGALAVDLEGSIIAAPRPAASPPPAPAISAREQRIASVILAGGPDLAGEDATINLAIGEPTYVRLAREAILACEGKPERLADGSVLASFGPAGIALDQATRASRCALALRRELPDAPITVVTGWADVGGGGDGAPVPSGEVIDRAAALLETARRGEEIRIDATTAGLAGARFEIGSDAAGLFLAGARAPNAPARTLLGKLTPCVGRDFELSRLLGLFDESAGESVARAALVRAPAGAGKSRLAAELCKRIAARGEPAAIWIGEGDPAGRGTSLGLLGDVVRSAAGIAPGDLLPVRRQKLKVLLERHKAALDVEAVLPFLGELCGTPFDAPRYPELGDARLDPARMNEELRRAWGSLVAAACKAAPLVLVLEDLHWSDAATVAFLDASLKALADQPLFVLALGRPEVERVFPGLWSARDVTTVRLTGLSAKSAERLVREVLGGGASAAVVARIVERASGNPFYLEELLEAEASGRGATLPETVLGVAQARLDAEAPEARRLLRAGSVLGRSFPRGAAQALLGGEGAGFPLEAWLLELGRQEVLVARGEPVIAGEAEYGFRDAMLREAAYATLVPADRALGHRLAAAWLARAGFGDALALAEHWERGGEASKAAICYRHAAEQALESGELRAVAGRVDRAIACGATGEGKGAALAIAAEALRWLGENAAAEERATEAAALLPRDSAAWYTALGQAGTAAAARARPERAEAVARELGLSSGGETEETISAWMAASARVGAELFLAGRHELGRALLDRIEACADTMRIDPRLRALLGQARSSEALIRGDLGAWIDHQEEARARLDDAGDPRTACIVRVSSAHVASELGDDAAAEPILREALETASKLGLGGVAALAEHHLGRVLGRLGQHDEAALRLREAAQAFHDQDEVRGEGLSRAHLGALLAAAGDAAAGEQEARAAVQMLGDVPPARATALGILGRVLVARGSTDALPVARAAIDLLASLGGIDDGESVVRLGWAEAVLATGDRAAALGAIVDARRRLMVRAGRIGDEARRLGFLERVPDNRRTLELAASLERG